LLQAEDVFKDVSTLDKSVIEKVSLIEQLDKKEKAAFFTVLDAFVTKKRMKDSLSAAFASK